MMNAVRQAVWATDSGVALVGLNTLDDFIGEQLYAGPRFGFVLMRLKSGKGSDDSTILRFPIDSL
jgi:hypothetical protein